MTSFISSSWRNFKLSQGRNWTCIHPGMPTLSTTRPAHCRDRANTREKEDNQPQLKEVPQLQPRDGSEGSLAWEPPLKGNG